MSTAIQRIGTGWSIAPANMGELYKFAELMADSDLVPKDYKGKPGNVMVAIQMGGELGLSPMQSVQNIAVVNGRPTLWGDGLLAVCQAHPSFVDIIETDDGATATCVVKRANRTDVVATFSMEDAKRAGLAGKQGPWSQYPARMRAMRARGFALRNAFADALRGMISAEEARDIPKEVRAEVVSSKPVEEPKPAAQERKSTPPPSAEPPSFASSFPDKNYAGKLLTEAPFEILEDYRVWLEHVLKDGKKSKLHNPAKRALEHVSAEVDRRIDAESGEVKPDPVIEGLERVVQKQLEMSGEAEPSYLDGDSP